MYKILSHTADFAVKFSSKGFQELLNDVVIFFNREIYSYSNIKKFNKKQIILENKDENLSYFIIDILNEIIFNGEINYRIINIESLNENNVKLIFEEDFNLTLKIELKAATYHNLEQIENIEQIDITIVFDL